MQCHHRKKPKKKKLRKTTENAECWIMRQPYAWTNCNSCKILDLSSHNANSTIITGIQLQYSTLVELWTVIHGKTKALSTHRYQIHSAKCTQLRTILDDWVRPKSQLASSSVFFLSSQFRQNEWLPSEPNKSSSICLDSKSALKWKWYSTLNPKP
jgi:hypothetical protein